MGELDLTTEGRSGASDRQVPATPESPIVIDAPPPTSAPCRLRRDDEVVIDEPNATELAIEAEQLLERDCSFVVLEREPGCFLQAAPDELGMLWLEYRDGFEQPIYRVAGPLRSEQLAEILSAYARGDGGWVASYMWVEQSLPLPPAAAGPLSWRRLAWFAVPVALLALGVARLGEPFGLALFGLGAVAIVLALSSVRRR